MSEYLNVESKKSETQEREKRAETFLRFLNHAQAIDVFHGKKIEEVLGHENQKRNFIEDIKTEEFLGLLNGINGILRGRPKEKWNMDGKGIGLEGPLFGVGYLAPNQKNKPALLEKVLEAAKEMNRNGVDFKDIGLLISSTLNAIHPYGDGNGRTSRLLYLLLVQDFNSETKKELEQSLLRHGRDKIDINLGFIQHEIEDQIEKELGIKNPEINKDQILFIEDLKDDSQVVQAIKRYKEGK